MCEFTLDQTHVPASMRRAPDRPAPPRQGELFEQWEKLGLKSLFEAVNDKETNHGNPTE